MMPLFITSVIEFIRKTAKWWVVSIIVLAVLAIVAFIVWLIIIGLWAVPIIVFVLLFFLMTVIFD